MGSDHYEQWLQIPPNRRPPDHYDLLGVPVNERDPERIEQCAASRYEHVRKYAGGPEGPKANELLNELSQALTCLKSPDRKQDYDRRRIEAKVAFWLVADSEPGNFYELLDAPRFTIDRKYISAAVETALGCLEGFGDPSDGVLTRLSGLRTLLDAAKDAFSDETAFVRGQVGDSEDTAGRERTCSRRWRAVAVNGLQCRGCALRDRRAAITAAASPTGVDHCTGQSNRRPRSKANQSRIGPEVQ